MPEIDGRSSTGSGTSAYEFITDGKLDVRALTKRLVSSWILFAFSALAWFWEEVAAGIGRASDRTFEEYSSTVIDLLDWNSELFATAWETASSWLDPFGMFAFFMAIGVVAVFFAVSSRVLSRVRREL